MELEAIVFQERLGYSCSNKDLYNLSGGDWSSHHDLDLKETQEKLGSLDIVENQAENCLYNSPFSHEELPHLEQWICHSGIEPEMVNPQEFQPSETSTVMTGKCKRRRSKSKKKMEDIENQRMLHIAVERNRRKLMNEYLSVLRSLMPDSYVQKVDQASIVGGAINYVKELEQQLQYLSGQSPLNQDFESDHTDSSSTFAEFFAFPQYAISSSKRDNSTAILEDSMADIEVIMVESHANIKIRSQKRPKQLLKLVKGLESLRLAILHLNVTTSDQIVLYSLSVKVEADCKLYSIEEIATAVNQMLARI